MPMSDPARLFQSLHLDDMPVTRSQSQIPQQRGGRSPRGGGRRRGRGRAQPQVGPIRSHSGIQYDTQMLSPTSSRRAAEGLQSEFMVDRLEGFNFGRDRYYAFQLSKPVAVRIHDPAVGADRIFECTCAEFRNNFRPCAHVWWLFDGLHAVRSKDEQGAAAPRPTQLELIAQFSELFPFIAERQATLPRELNRLGVDVPDPDDELPVPDILNDILASFYDDMIPDEVNDDFVNKVSHVSPDDILVEGNLPATIYRLALRDDAFCRRLQQLVPREVRAKRYYETQYLRLQATLQRLNRYAETGPSADRLPGSPSDLDVPDCARLLRSIVHQMCEDHDARSAVVPLDDAAASQLALILVRLIEEVVHYNKDIYQGAQWNRAQPANEHPRERNLFAYLIGDPPYAYSSDDPLYNARFPSWEIDHFVIDRLQGFPTDQWIHLFEKLTNIKDKIEEFDTREMPMSLQYAGRIDEMLRAYTATVHEPSSSTYQMPRPG